MPPLKPLAAARPAVAIDTAKSINLHVNSVVDRALQTRQPDGHYENVWDAGLMGELLPLFVRMQHGKDPKLAQQMVRKVLPGIARQQLPDGSFPLYPGGPGSRAMTEAFLMVVEGVHLTEDWKKAVEGAQRYLREAKVSDDPGVLFAPANALLKRAYGGGGSLQDPEALQALRAMADLFPPEGEISNPEGLVLYRGLRLLAQSALWNDPNWGGQVRLANSLQSNRFFGAIAEGFALGRMKSLVGLDEKAAEPVIIQKPEQILADLKALVDAQSPNGSWSYMKTTTAVALTALKVGPKLLADRGVALKPELAKAIAEAKAKALASLGQPRVVGDRVSFGGFTSGEVWGTTLPAGLLANVAQQDPTPELLKGLKESLRWLLGEQIQKGPGEGLWPFASGSGKSPDTDTSATVVGYPLVNAVGTLEKAGDAKLAGRVSSSVISGVRALLSKQNESGGWGAFGGRDAGGVESLKPDTLAQSIFEDRSSADVTSRVMMALSAALPLLRERAPELAREAEQRLASARNLLLAAFEKEPLLWSRWTAGYLAGTSLSLAALKAAGADMKAPALQAAAERLVKAQLPDGSWGESTAADVHPDQALVAKEGTPVQTALALAGVAAVYGGAHPAVEKGVSYLLAAGKEGRWANPKEALFTLVPGFYYDTPATDLVLTSVTPKGAPHVVEVETLGNTNLLVAQTLRTYATWSKLYQEATTDAERAAADAVWGGRLPGTAHAEPLPPAALPTGA